MTISLNLCSVWPFVSDIHLQQNDSPCFGFIAASVCYNEWHVTLFFPMNSKVINKISCIPHFQFRAPCRFFICVLTIGIAIRNFVSPVLTFMEILLFVFSVAKEYLCWVLVWSFWWGVEYPLPGCSTRTTRAYQYFTVYLWGIEYRTIIPCFRKLYFYMLCTGVQNNSKLMPCLCFMKLLSFMFKSLFANLFPIVAQSFMLCFYHCLSLNLLLE